MKILIDDFRTKLPDGSDPDIIIKNYDAASIFIQEWVFFINEDIFLDHDLGHNDERCNGYALISQIEQNHMIFSRKLPKSITCVSDNGPGRKRIQLVIDKLYGRL